MRGTSIVALGLVLTACAPGFPPVPDDCRATEVTERIVFSDPTRLDLLLVIDTHDDDPVVRSAIADRAAAAIRSIVTGDVDLDGAPELQAIHDLVVTPIAAMPGCSTPSGIAWHEGSQSPGDPDLFAAALRDAVIALPACERSAPLETALEALPDARRDPAFALVLAVTDEDEPGATDHALPLIDAARGVLGGLSVALIAGLDPTASWSRESGPPIDGCDIAPLSATAAPGLDAAATSLHDRGATVAIGSICAASWAPALEPTIPFVPRQLGCFCLPRVVGSCSIVEQLSPAGYHRTCDELAGRDPVPLGAVDGADTCELVPFEGTGSGWQILDSTTGTACELQCGGAPAISFLDVAAEPGATIRVQCASIEGDCTPP